MANLQPINEWFGIEPRHKPPKIVWSKEDRKKAKEAEEKVEYVEAPPITADEEWFRHHNWKAKRERVAQAMRDADASCSAMANFANCGSDCIVEYNKEANKFRIRGNYCHSRHCEPCMKAKSALITANLRARLTDTKGTQKRFITLTLQHSDEPLKDQIKFLYASYKQLRATKIWKRTQKGGATTLEVKWIPKTRKWHPHLHIISEGTMINQAALSDEWRRITVHSYICDVRLIDKGKDVAFYVGKYVTKGTNAEVWDDPAVAAEWIKAVKGVRMCATYGTWRGYKLLARPPEEKGAWVFHYRLSELAGDARRGELAAIALLLTLEESHQYNPRRKRRPAPI